MKNKLKSMNMKNILAALVAVWMLAFQAAAQENGGRLTFGDDGKFKIVQFTDLHIRWQDPRSDTAFACIRNVVEAERPDLIVLTGDIIYSAPAADNFKRVLGFVGQFGIPYALVFGNHDREQGLPNAELLKIARQMPGCLASDTEGLTGDGNYILEVQGSKDKSVKSLLYFFDSNRTSQLEERGVGGYDFIHRDQVNWYAAQSARYTQQNGGTPVPALAFFHIPLPEYNQAAADENTTLYGIRREKACSPLLNTGLFATMKEQGDVMGVFVGHDHDNDYAVNWYGILLAYGRFTGGPTEYIHIPNGARVIELTEGQRTIDTHIRLASGKVEQQTSFPKDYVK